MSSTNQERAINLLNDAKLCADASRKVCRLILTTEDLFIANQLSHRPNSLVAPQVDRLKGMLEILIHSDPSLIPIFLPELLELQVDPAPPVRKFLCDFIDAAVTVHATPETVVGSLGCLRSLLTDDAVTVIKRALSSADICLQVAIVIAMLHFSESGVEQLWESSEVVRGLIMQQAAEHPNQSIRVAAIKIMGHLIAVYSSNKLPIVRGVNDVDIPMPAGSVDVVTKAGLAKAADEMLGVLVGCIRQGDLPEQILVASIYTASKIAEQRAHLLMKIMAPLLQLAPKIVYQKNVASALKTSLLSHSHSAQAVAWHKKITLALQTLGVIEESTDQQTGKRPGDTSTQPAKKQKLEPRPMISVAAGAHPMTPQGQLTQVQTVIQALVIKKDVETLVAVVNGLQPGVLADLALSYLSRLPPALPSDSSPLDSWMDQLLTALAVQVTRERTPQPPDEAAAQHIVKPVRLVVRPVDPETPIELSSEETSSLRKGAVLRILQTEKTSAPQLRATLVARLAVAAGDDDGISEVVLQHVFKDFHGRDGIALALDWLQLLFLQECSPIDGNGGEITSEVPDVTGSRYELVFTALLEGLREALPPNDKTLIQMLVEAPALPMPSTSQFLQDVCLSGPDWATLALLAARDIILHRPPARPDVLSFVLSAAISQNDDIRSKAVRLIANRLYPLAFAGQTIEEYSKQLLNEAVNISDQQPIDMESENSINWTAEDKACAYSALYCALCTKKHALLRGLIEAYSRASAPLKMAIEKIAPGLAKTIGSTAPTLLTCIQDPPPGSLDLVLQMINVLTESVVPPPLLVGACLHLFQAVDDPRVLQPVLIGMEKAAVLKVFPRILELSPEELRQTVKKLITPVPPPIGFPEDTPETPALFARAEILAALLSIEHGSDQELLKRMVGALSIFMASPDIFPPEALAAAINQLLTRFPLPSLFMRAVVQTLTAAPKLKSFIIGVLQQLVTKKIWTQESQWKGWVLCAEHAAPESFAAVLQLPTDVLRNTLSLTKPGFREQLLAFISSPQCTVLLTKATRTTVQNSAKESE